ncbi:uncharacterized protein DS421_12g384960 [Arachis hypogaea]|nr:uncharacterized protein DS421_12g384960 [Arachis hypogaea]
MTKHNMFYVIIIMIIIGTIICFVMAEFDGFIGDNEKASFPRTTEDAIDLAACYNKCNQSYDKLVSPISKHRWENCRMLCKALNNFTETCKELYGGNKDKYKRCIEEWNEIVKPILDF